MKKNTFQGTVQVVPIKELYPDPNQPRQDFDQEEMDRLKDSIVDKGIMSPITVEPKKNNKYLIVDGERRFRTAVKLKMKEIPISILPEELDEFNRNIIRFQLQETHKQWTLFEKADAMINLKDNLGLTGVELAKALTISVVTCRRYLSLISFPIDTRKIFIKAKVPFNLVVDLSYTHNILPEQIKKEIPDYLEKALVKYQKGYLKASHDLRVINKLVKFGQYEYVIKYFKQLDYTVTNAASDSGLVVDDFALSILRASNKLVTKLSIVEKNKIKLSDQTILALNELKKLI